MLRVVLLIIVIFASTPSFAFSFDNHRVICQMAYAQISPKAQQNIDRVIQSSPYKTFADACVWPDQAKKKKPYQHTKAWHYLNVPRHTNQVEMRLCPRSGCLLSAINEAQTKLKRQPQNWQNLLFLSHFIGDLHQPLHISYADDLGGNKMHLQYRKRATNLHTLWDGELLKRQKWQKRSAELLADINVRQKMAWRSGNPTVWATESLHLTQDAYRLLPKSKKVTDKYMSYFAPRLEQQLQKASVRLAAYLMQIYG